MDKKEILAFLTDNKIFFKENFKVTKIGLFGSYIHDTQTENSDIDIIVTMPSDFDNYFALKEFLEEHFKRKVDLGLEKNLRSLIKNKIKDEIMYA